MTAGEKEHAAGLFRYKAAQIRDLSRPIAFPRVLSELEVSVSSSQLTPPFTLKFTLSGLEPPTYTAALFLESKATTVLYGPDGNVQRVLGVNESSVSQNNWAMVFYLSFDSAKKVIPNIDMPATMKKVLGLANSSLQNVRTVDDLLIYKPAQP